MISTLTNNLSFTLGTDFRYTQFGDKIKDINVYELNAITDSAYINEELIHKFNNTFVNSRYCLYLFARNGTDTPIFTNATNQKVYYSKIIKLDHVVQYLIPCYRKTDNKPGMYDVVNDIFYTNAGTGEFILGPNV